MGVHQTKEILMVKFIKDWIKASWEAFEEHQQRRADYMVMMAMPDRELKDIGITRSEIQERISGKKK